MEDKERQCSEFLAKTTSLHADGQGLSKLCASASAAGGSGRPWAPFTMFLLCASLLGGSI